MYKSRLCTHKSRLDHFTLMNTNSLCIWWDYFIDQDAALCPTVWIQIRTECLVVVKRLHKDQWHLTLNAPITTAAADNFRDIFLNYRKKYGMIIHENRLPADDSHEISCLICYFWKSGKIWNCCLLQIIGSASRWLSTKYFPIADNAK